MFCLEVRSVLTLFWRAGPVLTLKSLGGALLGFDPNNNILFTESECKPQNLKLWYLVSFFNITRIHLDTTAGPRCVTR